LKEEPRKLLIRKERSTRLKRKRPRGEEQMYLMISRRFGVSDQEADKRRTVAKKPSKLN